MTQTSKSPAPATAATAEHIKVLTTGILKGAFASIAAEFERQTGHTVTTSWGLSSGSSPEASPVRVRSGEAAGCAHHGQQQHGRADSQRPLYAAILA